MSKPQQVLTLSVLPGLFAVCRLPAAASIPVWAEIGPFFSITRTPDELSVVCAQAAVPADVQAERDWRCLKVAGPLDFNLTGILAALAVPLAAQGISVFALSTYDTDYLLVKDAQLAQALSALEEAGHHIIAGGD